MGGPNLGKGFQTSYGAAKGQGERQPGLDQSGLGPGLRSGLWVTVIVVRVKVRVWVRVIVTVTVVFIVMAAPTPAPARTVPETSNVQPNDALRLIQDNYVDDDD